jgi:hypothetical protein
VSGQSLTQLTHLVLCYVVVSAYRFLSTDAMPQLVALATAPDTDAEVRSEVYWVILNATSCGSDSQVSHMITLALT